MLGVEFTAAWDCGACAVVFEAVAVALVAAGAAGLLGSAFFLTIGLATAAVGLGVPTTVAAGPGPVLSFF